MAEKTTETQTEKTTETQAEKKSFLDTLKELSMQTLSALKELSTKTMNFLEPLTQKVRDLVLTFGELIVTASIIIGVASAVIDGLSTMSTVGFFAGLSSMFSNIISIIMGALVIFLLFAIYKNTKQEASTTKTTTRKKQS
jgi:hypothetical protein